MKTRRNEGATVLLLGGAVLDRTFHVDAYPEPGQDALITGTRDAPGGSCLNAARVLGNLGSRPCVVSYVGSGEVGMALWAFIEEAGLPMDGLVSSPDQDTGTVMTMVDPSGERTFFTRRGCEARFSPDMVSRELVTGTVFTYLTGYYLLDTSQASGIPALLDRLRAAGSRILFDPGPLCGRIAATLLRSVLSRADWITPNRTELELLARRLGVGTGEALLEDLCTTQERRVVVKMGKDGALLRTREGSVRYPAYDGEQVDTTGAGDAFAAGLIHGLIGGVGIDDSLRIAGACGSLAIRSVGPQPNFTIEDVNRLIQLTKEQT